MSKTFNFVYTKPEPLPEPQPLRISLTDQATGAASAQSAAVNVQASVDWLSVIPTTGNTVLTANVQLTDAAKNLAIGTYNAQVEVTSNATEVMNSPQIAPVSLQVWEKEVPIAALSASPSVIYPGDTITAEWSGIPSPTATDWIALYSSPVAPNNAYIDWVYVSCSKTAETPRASGSCPSLVLPADLALGTYELRLFSEDTHFTTLAISNMFSLETAPPEPPIEELSLVLMPTAMQFVYKKPGNVPAQQSLRIFTAVPVGIELRCSSDWLTVIPAQGMTNLDCVVGLTNAAKKLAVGTYQAKIEVRSPSPNVSNSPQIAMITLEVVPKK
jgi:hypothetical protein